MLLKGAPTEAITSPPLMVFILAVLILMVVTAVTSVLVRDTLWSIGSFASTMALLALLYLAIAPFALFAVQLFIYTTLSAGLLLGALRQTAGLQPPLDSPLNRQWIAGAVASAALLALIGVVVGATSWPVRVAGGEVGLGDALTTTYVVGLATVAVLIASAGLGVALLLAGPGTAARSRRADPAAADRDRRRPRAFEPRP